MDKTPWFVTSLTPPVRRGVYERDVSTVGRFAYWDGSKWYGYAQNPAAARASYRNRYVSTFQFEGQWRGLVRRADSTTAKR